MSAPAANPIEVTVHVEGKPLTMELDTGAAVFIISEETRRKILPQVKLRKSKIILKTYTDQTMEVVGQLNVHVKYGTQTAPLILVVMTGNGPSLFGRNWLTHIQLDWKRIATVEAVPHGLTSLLTKHDSLFKEELGTVHPYKATLHVNSDATPKFFKPRPMPFALKDAVGQELDRLEKQGVIKKVDSSDWAAPIVTVPKKEGKIRICGDYKVTINQALTVDQYPLPKPEDLFATLAKGKRFSTLDLSQAYLQLQLDDSSMPYVTINTHQGLYQYTRLPFGVAFAPALFQRLMETILQGIPRVVCYIDDILVTGENEEEHLRNLEEVFSRLEKHGFRLKKSKCKFSAKSVDYLGHRIDENGIRALPNKVDAIANAPHPTNVPELRLFLVLLNYCGKFIRNLSTILHPLNHLLQTHQTWNSTTECSDAFQMAKDQLVSAEVLTHYDPDLPIRMAADASAYGIGAVISIEHGCLLWGIRVIIPTSLRQQLLKALHEGHPGVVRMKAIARSYIWWSGLDKDVEKQAKACLSCQEEKPNPPAAPLHTWQWPTTPWKRIHVDFAGPFLGKMFLIMVDAHSKWPEVIMMSTTTTTQTIEVLQAIFSRYGLPEQLISDNGPQFTSQEFVQCLKQGGIKHIRSAPYQPSTNGLAERFVQTFENAMKASENDGQSLKARIATFLANYRSTPHATTGVTPSELFLQRKVRTKFDMLKPDTQSVVDVKQSLQKKYHDNRAKLCTFTPGQTVMARDYLSSKKWVLGVIESSSGPTMYRVKLINGKIVVRHVDQLLAQLPVDASNTQPDDRFTFFDGESAHTDPQLPPSDNQPDDEVPAPRYNLRRDSERRPVERLMNLQT